jgi:hypothetical protein
VTWALAAPAPGARRLRWRPILAIAAVLLALGGIAAAILGPGDDRRGENSGGAVTAGSDVSAAPPKDTLAAIKNRCQQLAHAKAMMVQDWNAREEWHCEHPSFDLNYAVFASAGKADSTIREVYGNNLRSKDADTHLDRCDNATQTQIATVKNEWKGTTYCGVTPARDLTIFWIGEGSPVVGQYTVGKNVDPHDAVNEWATQLTSPG